MTYTRKDLILLQKYKDENYKKALVDQIVSQAKAQTLQSAIQGETAIRIAVKWASSKQEAEELQAQEALIREALKSMFPDVKVEVDVNSLSFILFEFWELVIKLNWGGYTT
jgi:transcriptional/translational regulatory protein YebC/TACO1